MSSQFTSPLESHGDAPFHDVPSGYLNDLNNSGDVCISIYQSTKNQFTFRCVAIKNNRVSDKARPGVSWHVIARRLYQWLRAICRWVLLFSAIFAPIVTAEMR